jgi:hypothetical protein
MPLNEIPKYINPEARRLIDSALAQAWPHKRLALHAERGMAHNNVR